MTNWHRPSPAQPNPPQSHLPLLTEVKPVLSATNREKTMKYIKKLWKKYVEWLFKDFYKQIMWINIAAKLVPGIIKTGMSIAANRRKTKELESIAELKLAEKMANGEVEYKKAVIDSHRGDLKDEFCLILISIPLLLLAWSVFSDDPDIQAKIDIFFDKFSNLPMFYQALVVGAFSTILGIKGVSTFKKK